MQASQQARAEQKAFASDASPVSGNEDENTNPFGNNTEEKAPTSSSSSFSEEYLHDHNKSDFLTSITSQYRKCENAGTYVAFHGELLVPPPNVA